HRPGRRGARATAHGTRVLVRGGGRSGVGLTWGGPAASVGIGPDRGPPQAKGQEAVTGPQDIPVSHRRLVGHAVVVQVRPVRAPEIHDDERAITVPDPGVGARNLRILYRYASIGAPANGQ